MNIPRKSLPLLLGALALLTATACGPKNTYVLVHGAWQGAWAWDEVKPRLEKEGHEVVVVELPAHGADTTPATGASLQGYTDKVVQALDAQEGPVFLVGHSMGGTVISQAAEARPDKVRKLVYVAAYLLKDGQSLLDLAYTDKQSLLGTNLTYENDGTVARVKPETLVETFCADCSETAAARLRAKEAVEPTAPLGTPIKVTSANFGRVPRVYITTTQDRAVGPDLQKRMYTETPVEKVLSLDTGHSPFLSQPEAFSKLLSSL